MTMLNIVLKNNKIILLFHILLNADVVGLLYNSLKKI